MTGKIRYRVTEEGGSAFLDPLNPEKARPRELVIDLTPEEYAEFQRVSKDYWDWYHRLVEVGGDSYMLIAGGGWTMNEEEQRRVYIEVTKWEMQRSLENMRSEEARLSFEALFALVPVFAILGAMLFGAGVMIWG